MIGLTSIPHPFFLADCCGPHIQNSELCEVCAGAESAAKLEEHRSRQQKALSNLIKCILFNWGVVPRNDCCGLSETAKLSPV